MLLGFLRGSHCFSKIAILIGLQHVRPAQRLMLPRRGAKNWEYCQHFEFASGERAIRDRMCLHFAQR
jgi:hypothetical protein